MYTGNSPGNIAPADAGKSPKPSTEGRPGTEERFRLIPQRTGPFTIQYLVIDAHHSEIVATYPTMSAAMAHRDRLDPVSP
jgi:hypothetical protein